MPIETPRDIIADTPTIQRFVREGQGDAVLGHSDSQGLVVHAPVKPPSGWTEFKAILHNLPLICRLPAVDAAHKEVSTFFERLGSQRTAGAEFWRRWLGAMRAHYGDETTQYALEKTMKLKTRKIEVGLRADEQGPQLSLLSPGDAKIMLRKAETQRSKVRETNQLHLEGLLRGDDGRLVKALEAAGVPVPKVFLDGHEEKLIARREKYGVTARQDPGRWRVALPAGAHELLARIVSNEVEKHAHFSLRPLTSNQLNGICKRAVQKYLVQTIQTRQANQVAVDAALHSSQAGLAPALRNLGIDPDTLPESSKIFLDVFVERLASEHPGVAHRPLGQPDITGFCHRAAALFADLRAIPGMNDERLRAVLARTVEAAPVGGSSAGLHTAAITQVLLGEMAPMIDSEAPSPLRNSTLQASAAARRDAQIAATGKGMPPWPSPTGAALADAIARDMQVGLAQRLFDLPGRLGCNAETPAATVVERVRQFMKEHVEIAVQQHFAALREIQQSPALARPQKELLLRELGDSRRLDREQVRWSTAMAEELRDGIERMATAAGTDGRVGVSDHLQVLRQQFAAACEAIDEHAEAKGFARSLSGEVARDAMFAFCFGLAAAGMPTDDLIRAQQALAPVAVGVPGLRQVLQACEVQTQSKLDQLAQARERELHGALSGVHQGLATALKMAGFEVGQNWRETLPSHAVKFLEDHVNRSAANPERLTQALSKERFDGICREAVEALLAARKALNQTAVEAMAQGSDDRIAGWMAGAGMATSEQWHSVLPAHTIGELERLVRQQAAAHAESDGGLMTNATLDAICGRAFEAFIGNVQQIDAAAVESMLQSAGGFIASALSGTDAVQPQSWRDALPAATVAELERHVRSQAQLSEAFGGKPLTQYDLDNICERGVAAFLGNINEINHKTLSGEIPGRLDTALQAAGIHLSDKAAAVSPAAWREFLGGYVLQLASGNPAYKGSVLTQAAIDGLCTQAVALYNELQAVPGMNADALQRGSAEGTRANGTVLSMRQYVLAHLLESELTSMLASQGDSALQRAVSAGIRDANKHQMLVFVGGVLNPRYLVPADLMEPVAQGMKSDLSALALRAAAGDLPLPQLFVQARARLENAVQHAVDQHVGALKQIADSTALTPAQKVQLVRELRGTPWLSKAQVSFVEKMAGLMQPGILVALGARDAATVFDQMQALDQAFQGSYEAMKDAAQRVFPSAHAGDGEHNALFGLCARIAMSDVDTKAREMKRFNDEALEIVVNSEEPKWPGLAAVRQVIHVCDRVASPQLGALKQQCVEALTAAAARLDLADNLRQRVLAELVEPRRVPDVAMPFLQHVHKRVNEDAVQGALRAPATGVAAALDAAGLAFAQGWRDALPQSSVNEMDRIMVRLAARRDDFHTKPLTAGELNAIAADAVIELLATVEQCNAQAIDELLQHDDSQVRGALQAAGIDLPDDWRASWPASTVAALESHLRAQAQGHTDYDVKPLTRGDLDAICRQGVAAFVGDAEQIHAAALQGSVEAVLTTADRELGDQIWKAHVKRGPQLEATTAFLQAYVMRLAKDAATVPLTQADVSRLASEAVLLLADLRAGNMINEERLNAVLARVDLQGPSADGSASALRALARQELLLAELTPYVSESDGFLIVALRSANTSVAGSEWEGPVAGMAAQEATKLVAQDLAANFKERVRSLPAQLDFTDEVPASELLEACKQEIARRVWKAAHEHVHALHRIAESKVLNREQQGLLRYTIGTRQRLDLVQLERVEAVLTAIDQATRDMAIHSGKSDPGVLEKVQQLRECLGAATEAINAHADGMGSKLPYAGDAGMSDFVNLCFWLAANGRNPDGARRLRAMLVLPAYTAD